MPDPTPLPASNAPELLAFCLVCNHDWIVSGDLGSCPSCGSDQVDTEGPW